MNYSEKISLEKEIASVLNQASAENASDTPDFILATFLMGCLEVFNSATRQRENWHGRGQEGQPKKAPHQIDPA